MKPQLRLHFIVLLWGFTGILGKLISIEALPLVFWRTLIGVFSILLFLWMVKIPLRISLQNGLLFLGVGCIIGLHWFSFFQAIKVSNVSVALSTLATGSFFAAILEPLFFKKKIQFYELLISSVVIACLWLIFKTSPDALEGILWGVFCSFLSALFSVLNALLEKQNKAKPQVIMLYEMLGAWLFIGVVLLALGYTINSLQAPAHDFIWLFLLGSIFTAYPMIESVRLMKYISPFTLVLTVNLEPVYGILIAFFLFESSEQMQPLFYVATACMLASLVANAYIKKKYRKKVT